MNAPLYNAIKSLTAAYPLHMPGHKRNVGILPSDLLELDITEIDGSDNLHAPSGAIKQAERAMAELYGCDESVFCVNGGSSGILAAVLGTCCPGDLVLSVKNAHKSLQNALILSGASVVYADTPQSGYGFALPADPGTIEKALKLYPEIKAVFIVSPTYEGFCADIDRISRIVHSFGKILIVDETHGAHFPFADDFAANAAVSGADISVASWHKTMPVPNQCAVLNINRSRVDHRRIMQAFSMVTTTSPSYIFMGLMDYVRAYYTEHPDAFKRYTALLKKLRAELNGLRNIALADKKTSGYAFDISKLTFVCSCKESAADITSALKTYGFELEMTGQRHFIAMTSVADAPEKLQLFADALKNIDKTLTHDENKIDIKPGGHLSGKINQRELFYAPKKALHYQKTAGCTAADFVTPFPPDIPLITAGEKITKEQINELSALISAGIEILGCEDGMINIKEEG